MDKITKELLEQVADLHEIPAGAYNIRKDGELYGRNVSANIDIVTKKDKPGIDIIIKDNTVKESVHIPVIISQSGLKEAVYNDFYIGENCDVTIIAGCGIHKTLRTRRRNGRENNESHDQNSSSRRLLHGNGYGSDRRNRFNQERYFRQGYGQRKACHQRENHDT